MLIFAHDFSEEIHLFLENWFSSEDFILVKTSGSTGNPKTIQLQKKHMVNSALATGDFFNLKENTTALLCLPVAYIAGKMMLIRAFTLGWNIDIITSNSIPLKNIFKCYDFSAMVPLQVENSIEKLHQIKKLIVGGGVVSTNLQEKLQTITTEVYATYGMTETITHIAVKKLNQFSSLRVPNPREKQSLSEEENNIYIDGKAERQMSPRAEPRGYYQTLPNTTIYKDERNCLVIKNTKVSDEVIFTNDVVNLISDKQFEWLGRFDNVINSGGIKLHPEKIEEKLADIIAQRFFVAGIWDEKLGEKLVLVIEYQSFKVSEFQSSFIEKIKNLQTLSKYEIPKEIYFIDAFVETETGKVQRKKTLQKIQTNS